MSWWRGLVMAAIGCALVATAAEAATEGVRVEVAGTELRVTLPDGHSASGRDLVGAVLGLRAEDDEPMTVRIEEMLPDPRDPSGKVLLYRFAAQDRAGAWRPICSPDPDGERLGIAQPGADGRVVIWCTSGGLAKCVRFGYHPWESLPDGTPLAPYHRACLRMMRADYTGTDRPTTRNGMLIDVFDFAGVQSPDLGPSAMPFEAAWAEDGAVCIAHVRVPQNTSFDQLAAAAPRLAGRLGEPCTVEAALAWGKPLVFNRSRGDGIPGR